MQPLRIIGEALDRERLWRQEAMAAGGLSGFNRAEANRHDLAVEQTEDAVQRPHPADVIGTPAHRLRPWKASQYSLDHRTEQVVRPHLCPIIMSSEPGDPILGLSTILLG
jgi:hypothetical protein